MRGERPDEEAGRRADDPEPTTRRRSSPSWARLIAKVFQVDPLVCRRCGGPLKVVAAYAVSGSLVAYLLDRFGIEPMVAFIRECGSSPQGYEHAFRRAYGRTVARATIDWQRGLVERATTSRDWYDPAGWPRSLQRGGATTEASARPVPLVISRPEYLSDAVVLEAGP